MINGRRGISEKTGVRENEVAARHDQRENQIL